MVNARQLNVPSQGLDAILLAWRRLEIVYFPQLGLEIPIYRLLGVIQIVSRVAVVFALDLQQVAHIDVHLLLLA